jgi:uncharacterized OB-fold protein
MVELDNRPVPIPSSLSKPFWDGCSNGQLMVLRCDACGHYVFIPDPMCPNCQSRTLTWVESSGIGTIDSFTIVHRPQQPSFAVPYVVAIVELEEGWYLPTNIVDIEPDQVRIGMPVRVRFERRGEDMTVPLFVPA